jgi:hypothetical protein
MENKSIFTRQNQTLIKLFRDARHPEMVLCVPLDYARQTHVALCCNGSGRCFAGTLDDFLIYNRALGENEIKTLYHSERLAIAVEGMKELRKIDRME